MASYKSTVRPCDISSVFNGVSRQHVQELVSRLPSGLEYTCHEWSLLRAATELAGCTDRRRLYTDGEMCNALKALLEGKITQQAASQKFGQKVPTLQKYLRKVREMVDAGLSLDSALKALEFPPPGPRPLLSQDELDLLVAKADTSADHGKGFSTRRLSAEAKRLCATIAEKENDPKMRERLENAKCGVSWRRRALSMSNTLGVTFRKAFDLSERRAAAKDGESTQEMFKRIRAIMYAEHRATGILSAAEPDSDQVWNADEVGFDPKGRGKGC